MNPEIIEKIRQAAKAEGCDSVLALAISLTESAGQTMAVRFEPEYKYLVDPLKFARLNGITKDTEETLQKCSWGLMQVMGGVARELGYKEMLPGLCDPLTGAVFGCRKLAALGVRYREQDEVIAAYNAGSARRTAAGIFTNQGYVNLVRRALVVVRKYK